jgi:hypothetical protein
LTRYADALPTLRGPFAAGDLARNPIVPVPVV